MHLPLSKNLKEVGRVSTRHTAALGLADNPGARGYLAARELNRVELQAGLAGAWEHVAGTTYQRRLFKLMMGM